MRIILYISLFILSFTHVNGLSQNPNYIVKAYEFYKNKDFQNAKLLIDSADNAGQISTDRSWMLKGLIYRELNNSDKNGFRITALEAFYKAKSVSKDPDLKKKINVLLNNTIITTYNECFNFLGTGSLIQSEGRYLRYKEQYLKYYDATFNFDDSDINYYNSLGSAWQKGNDYISISDQLIQLNTAVEKFQRVLTIDPDNYTANYLIGVAYYNRGANLILSTSPTAPLSQLQEIQEEAYRMFKNGLPFLLKAHELDPKNAEVIEGLKGIYNRPFDDEKFIYYDELLKKVKSNQSDN